MAKQPPKRNPPNRSAGKVRIPKFKVPTPAPAPAPVAAGFTGWANGNLFVLNIQVDAQGNLGDSVIILGATNVLTPIQGTFNFTTNELDFAFGTTTPTGFDVQSFHGFLISDGTVVAGIFQETVITVGPPVSIQQEEHGFWGFENPS